MSLLEHRQVIDAYLAEWTMYAPLEELREVFDDAMLIAPLHLAMMYRSVLLPAMEFMDKSWTVWRHTFSDG